MARVSAGLIGLCLILGTSAANAQCMDCQEIQAEIDRMDALIVDTQYYIVFLLQFPEEERGGWWYDSMDKWQDQLYMYHLYRDWLYDEMSRCGC